MSLLSVDIVVVEELEVEDWFSSPAHPERAASTKAARQKKIDVEGRMEVLVIFKRDRTPGTNFSNGVFTPLAAVPARATLTIMNLLVVLIVLMLLFGGGGFYLGGPLVGGGGFGLILLILLVMLFTGRLGSR
jgi:hypothetical protein